MRMARTRSNDKQATFRKRRFRPIVDEEPD
jgi:hypothetical protein